MRHRRSLIVLAVAARANWNDTTTGIDLNKLPRFPLVKIRAGYLGAPAKAGSMVSPIVPVKGCVSISTGVVVVDRPKLRQISFPTLRSEYPGELMEAIEREGLAVRLMGIEEKPRNGHCRVNLLWAK